MILLQLSHRFIKVNLFLIPLMIFIYADSSNKDSAITLESDAVTKTPNDETNGLFGYVALPFKKIGAFFKRIMGCESPKTWEYKGENVAVFAYEGKRKCMEDRFFIDEHFKGTDVRGVSLYAIFESYKGDISARYGVEKLMTSLKGIIIQLKTGKTNFYDNYRKMYMLKGGAINYLQLLKDEIMNADKNLLIILERLKDNHTSQLNKYTDEDGNIDEKKLENDGIMKKQLGQNFYLSGTKALIAIIDGSQLFTAYVGNEPIVMGKIDGFAQKLISKEEHLVGVKLFRLGNVERKFPQHRYEKSMNFATYVDVGKHDLAELQPKFLILASNGLWEAFNKEGAVEFINNRYNEHLFGAKSIVLEAEHKLLSTFKSSDNITVIILKINTPPK